MSQLIFRAGENFGIDNLSGSGLGFFGATFGQSVEVGSTNLTTFITNSTGTIQGNQVDNTSYVHPNSGIVNSAGPYDLRHIPNYLATLNIRFNHTSAVKTQNAEMRIYDRSNINNDPSGVTCYVAEIIHTAEIVGAGGSGNASWIAAHGSGLTVPFADSPGESGLSPNGPSTIDTNHDWYCVLSASPDSVGSKLFGAYFSTEYL